MLSGWEARAFPEKDYESERSGDPLAVFQSPFSLRETITTSGSPLSRQATSYGSSTKEQRVKKTGVTSSKDTALK